MKELAYQKRYVEEMVTTSVRYLQGEEPKLIIFQAPTGSGKTIMLAEALSQMVKELKGQKELAFIWISVNYLHEQSKDKLEQHFEQEHLLDCINISEIQRNEIGHNPIVFVNWESLNKEGVSLFMSDNERDWNLDKVVENTRDEGRDIVLIIDESHRAAKTSKAKEIVTIIKPKLTIEVSATPKEDITNDHKVTVPLKEVIAEGMIKQEIQINPGLGKVHTNEDIVRAALKKRKELKRLYEALGASINPLLLIQAPRKKPTDTRSPEEKIIEILNREGITTANNTLAIWLAEKDKKVNLDYLEKADSEVEVLVFKEAIAQGWDCPRASILLLQREWNSENYVFNIQTLGRIMRMPELKHYEDFPALNVGYVFTASNNFSIVEDLAKDYVSKVQMVRENKVYGNIQLPSQFIRRKREQQRLSGEFKECLLKVAGRLGIKERINIGSVSHTKTVGVEGEVSGIDRPQDVSFQETVEITKDREEICVEYTAFARALTHGFSAARSTEIIKSSLRTLFKKLYNISNEDEIASIVLNPKNTSEFERLIDQAKLQYATLPEKEDMIVPTPDWQVPESISVFDNFDEISSIKKSILAPYFVKRDKNGKPQWSKPEKTFIEGLEKTDNDVLWWYKNGEKESKFFGIAYEKEDKHLYGFYPDFLIKTKKELLVVEIKDNLDLKNENLLKLNAGKEYQNKYQGKQKLHFFIISPQDYNNFFRALKQQELESFKSNYEEKLIRMTQSRKVVEEKELLELYEEELKKALKNLNDRKLENDILKTDLNKAKTMIKELKVTMFYQAKTKPKEPIQDIRIPLPFNLCILGEVVDEDLIREKLRGYFAKYGVKPTNWDVVFYYNTKLKNSDVLNGLKRGQSKFNLIITGQIFSHSGKGNKSANILSELKKPKYIPHLVGSSPKDVLTVDGLLDSLEAYFQSLAR